MVGSGNVQDGSWEEGDLSARLDNFEPGEEPLQTTLRTDEQVIARVTDGIYRQPGAALRELVSNAYDADATRVTIQTDRPRFKRIVIDDDGLGMTPEALVHMLYHIGGSAKRTKVGASLGITTPGDPSRSPGGRPLIGKIGIGLFSVSQLTQAFQVITKVSGDDFRTIASVSLRQYSDQALPTDDPDGSYEAGKVLVWREPAVDLESHGTTVVLDAIRPQTRDTLRSTELWDAVTNVDAAGNRGPKPPRFHIGSVQSYDDGLLRDDLSSESLPWKSDTPPERAFSKLVNIVPSLVTNGVPAPSISKLFDYYLQMVWDLSLWAPLPYIDKHPFDVSGEDEIDIYAIVDGSAADPVILSAEQSVRSAFDLGDSVRSPDNFSVQIDDLDIRRPVKVSDLPKSSAAVKKPMLFVASENIGFQGTDSEISGGPLAFQAYLLWAPKLVPTEHSGVLVRVHDASGTRFDPDFFRFPVAEQRRMSQITCEIFVTRGFDGALNIDRESFNFAHPHAVALTKWLHSSLRRVIAVQKKVAAAALAKKRDSRAGQTKTEADAVVERVWESRADDGTDAPEVVFSDETKPDAGEGRPAYVFQRSEVVGEVGAGPNRQGRQNERETMLQQIAKILAAYGLLDHLSPDEQADLMRSIREMLQVYE